MVLKAWWYKASVPNFGDDISPIILEMLTGQEVVKSTEEDSLCSIGSIAFQNFPSPMQFWGSGAIDNNQGSSQIRNHKFHAVRGPQTRRRIIQAGGDCPEIYGDPGAVLPLLFDKESFGNGKKYEFGILPHYVDFDRVSTFASCSDDNVNLIDIRSGHMNVIEGILSCDKLVTSSLHGLIVGEAYGVPTAFVEFGTKLFGRLFKFRDYFQSTNRELEYEEHFSGNDFDFKKIENLLSRIHKPDFDLRKFINSFPAEVKSEAVLKYLLEGP